MLTIDINFVDAFEEQKHPRAKSGKHGGEFVKKGTGGAGAPTAKPQPQKPSKPKPAWQPPPPNPRIVWAEKPKASVVKPGIEPKPLPIADWPKPDPDNDHQIKLFEMAKSDQSINTRLAELEKYSESLARREGWSLSSIKGERYGYSLIKALGAEIPTAPTAQKPTEGQIETAEGAVRAKGPRYQQAIDLEKKARKFEGFRAAGAAEAIPTLGAPFWKKMGGGFKKSVRSYCGNRSNYKEINDALRGQKEPSPRAKESIEGIDKAFEDDASVVNEPIIIRRGETTPSSMIQQWKEQLRKGEPCLYTRTGYTSCSLDDMPYFVSNNTWIDFVVPRGARALGVLGIKEEENHVMLPHDVQTEVYEIYEHDGKTHIKCIVR